MNIRRAYAFNYLLPARLIKIKIQPDLLKQTNELHNLISIMEVEKIGKLNTDSVMDEQGYRWERGDKLSREMIEEDDNAAATNIDEESEEQSESVGGDNEETCKNDGNAFSHVGEKVNTAQDKTKSDKSNAESDMDIGGDDTDSDPEFLPIKPTDESDPNVASSENDSKQAGSEAPVAEYEETEINEDYLSYIFAPEDVIVERQDKKNFFYCNVCHCNIHNSAKNIKVHKKGKSHKAAMIKYKKAVVTAAKNATTVNKPGACLTFLDCYVERYKPRGYYCRVCNFIAEKIKGMDEHVHGKWHETNIYIMKEQEKMAQPKDNIEKGTQDEMKELDEEFFKLLEMSRLHSWNSHSSAIAEDASKYNVESGYKTQDPSIYSTSNDFQQNRYYQNYGNSGNQAVGSDQQAASFPYSQHTSEGPPAGQLQDSSSFLNTRFVIKNENHAQIVIEVIDSLLQTYLEHKLRGLPKLHFKSSYKSLETEQSAYHMNREGRTGIMEQTFVDSQNYKNQYVENRSSKRAYSNEAFYNEKAHGIPMGGKNYKSYNFQVEDESQYEPYYEQQTKKTVSSRSINAIRKYDDNFSGIMKESESTFDELPHFSSSYSDDASTKRMRYNQSFVKDSYSDFSNYNEDSNTLPRYTRKSQFTDYGSFEQDENFAYEDSTDQSNAFVNNTNKQYRNFKKENNFARNNRQRESYARDFSENYNRGSETGGKFPRGNQKFRSFNNNFTRN